MPILSGHQDTIKPPRSCLPLHVATSASSFIALLTLGMAHAQSVAPQVQPGLGSTASGADAARRNSATRSDSISSSGRSCTQRALSELAQRLLEETGGAVQTDRPEERATTSIEDPAQRTFRLTARLLASKWSNLANPVWAMSFSPDGTKLATAGSRGSASILDAQTGHRLLSLTGHDPVAVVSVAFAPDGSRLVTASSDHSARIFDANDGHQLQELRGDLTGKRFAVFSPDGKLVLTASAAGQPGPIFGKLPPRQKSTLRLWDSRTGQSLGSFEQQPTALCAQFVAEGSRYVSGDADGNLRVRDTMGKLLATYSGHRQAVRALAIVPDGSSVISGGDEGILLVHNLSSGTITQRTANSEDGAIYSIAVDKDGRHAAIASENGRVRVVKISRDGLVDELELPKHAGQAMSVAFSPDGNHIISAGLDGVIWKTPISPSAYAEAACKRISQRGPG